MSIIKIWKNKGKILEGLKNSVFKQEHIEEIANERMTLCRACPHIDMKGDKCELPGTAPCCGLCGCCLSIKTRSLSSDCALSTNKKWKAILNQDEEDLLEANLRRHKPGDEGVGNT